MTSEWIIDWLIDNRIKSRIKWLIFGTRVFTDELFISKRFPCLQENPAEKNPKRVENWETVKAIPSSADSNHGDNDN